MVGARAAWGLGILALALWAGVPCALGQQQGGTAKAGKRGSRQQQSGRRSTAGASRKSSSETSSGGGSRAKSVPESGAPTLENPHPAATLQTLPNQTLTPGATSVPGNSGGIAPASNGASSGEYTPSQGQTAPTTPGGNPSETQGVPTFSSAAQPANANLPRTVHPAAHSRNPGAGLARATRKRKTSKSSTQ